MSLGIEKEQLCGNLESFINKYGWGEAVIILRQAFEPNNSFLLTKLDIALRSIQFATPEMLQAISDPDQHE